MTVEIFDARVCALGEGAFWHPTRHQFFWFDILNHKLLSRTAEEPTEWCFGEAISAAGWVDEDTLLVASETALWRFDLVSGNRERIMALEAENTVNRSNDGRADPQGGFWIGTMGFKAEAGAGAIYRYYRGELRKLIADITVPNSICFAPGGGTAYYTDTPTMQVMQVPLDAEGWPVGSAEVFLDLKSENLKPDGAVADTDGTLWIAHWGAGRVAAYGPDARFLKAFDLPAKQVTCPAFGGPDLRTLFVTSATQGLSDDLIARAPDQGKTFYLKGVGTGRAEPRVIL